MHTPSSNTTLFRTHDLCKTYPDGNVQALAHVDITVGQGEFVAVMGPSGSGKSTLLNLLGGLDRPSQGEIFYKEEPLSAIRNLDWYRASKVGYVFQAFLLLPTLTALENVQIPMFGGPLSARQRAQRARELLHSMRLDHRAGHLPGALSAGERQRVAIARALANEPEVLLADEPTGNLDTRTAEDLLKSLDQLHRDRNLTLVIITHSEALAQRSQRIIRLEDGRVRSDGLPQSGG